MTQELHQNVGGAKDFLAGGSEPRPFFDILRVWITGLQSCASLNQHIEAGFFQTGDHRRCESDAAFSWISFSGYTDDHAPSFLARVTGALNSHRLLLRRLIAFKRSGARILGRPDGSILFCMLVRDRGRSDSPSFDRRNAVVLPTRTAGTSLQCRRGNFISSILRS